MIEKAYRFGENRNLVGIVTEAGERTVNRRLPGVLILNAGLLHHVGPYRLHVTLARRLAATGLTVLRFDLSGVGDSEPRRNTPANDICAQQDVREAIDFLTQRNQLREVFVIGLCSGAKNAHKIAVLDQRVMGAVMLDGYVFPTWRQRVLFYGTRLLSLRRWKNLVSGRYLRRWTEGRDRGERENSWILRLPPKREVAEELRILAKRGVDMLYVYTGEGQTYNYRRQFLDAFSDVDFRGRVQVAFFKESDHTYSQSRARGRLVKEILEWLQAVLQTRSGCDEAVESQHVGSG